MYINIIHLMCWNYLIALITHSRNRQHRNKNIHCNNNARPLLCFTEKNPSKNTRPTRPDKTFFEKQLSDKTFVRDILQKGVLPPKNPIRQPDKASDKMPTRATKPNWA